MKYLITGGSGFIGTNLIDELLGQNHQVANLDIAPPKEKAHSACWQETDILDAKAVSAAFREFEPDFIVHLAARTDTDGGYLSDYVVNTEGTKNVLDAINSVNSIQRAVIASTQFVNQYNGVPKDDFDFAPHTVYGESKVINEKMTREANLKCAWTIIRPTNIWGPWHPRYPTEFWRVLGKGLYFHPMKKRVVRSYGYVKNVVFQIIKITEADLKLVASQVFYVGDEPIDLMDWVNGFSVAQIGREVRVVPAPIVRILALCGDALGAANIRFPITSSRFKSMTTDNGVPMKRTIEAFGVPPYDLNEGIQDTVRWLKVYYPNLVKT